MSCIVSFPKVLFEPSHEPDALHAVVLLEVHCNVVVSPTTTLNGSALKDRVGLGIGAGGVVL